VRLSPFLGLCGKHRHFGSFCTSFRAVFISPQPILLFYREAIRIRETAKLAGTYHTELALYSVGTFGAVVSTYLIEGCPVTADGQGRIHQIENVYSHYNYKFH
jgi:hypothetical protein